MKKRLLTAWIIACMFICLVGQTPLVALADGDDTRVISVPEGLQELLINEAPEVQTEEIENTTEDSIDVPAEQNEVIDETNEAPVEQGEVIDETNEVPNEIVDETNEIPAEQVGEVESGIGEAPIAQTEEPAVQTEVVETPSENPSVQSGNATANTPECVEKTVEALLPEGTHNYGDIVRVSGLLPVDAIVEAIPVDVEIEGQIVLLAYDITIYENEEKKNAGIGWQPEEGGLNVEFISSALEESEEEVNIWHMEDAEQNPEYVTAAPSNDDSVEFVAESFSVYVVTETKLTATIVASDGNTYEINVTYDNKSGIPMEGTALKVDELKPLDEGYDEYIDESALKVGVKTEDLEFSKVFDIKIVDENDENIEYEPTGDVDVSIRVIGVSLSEYYQVNVLHFVEERNEESRLVYDLESTVIDETVDFSTDSFSIYTIVAAKTPFNGNETNISTPAEIDSDQAYYFSIAREGTNFMTTSFPGAPNSSNTGEGEFVGTTNKGSAGLWYFEESTESGKYYIYAKDGNTKKYLYVYDTKSLKLNENEGTAFSVANTANNQSTFKIIYSSGGTNYALSVRGKNNGRNFFLETRANDNWGNNEKVTITKAAVIPDDYYELDGKSYGLMYYEGSTSAMAMMAIASGNGLNKKEMFVRRDPMQQNNNLFVARDSDISFWTFESIGADKYYLKCGDNYLKITTGGVSLVDTLDTEGYCEIRVESNNDGKIKLIGEKSYREIKYNSGVFKIASLNSGDFLNLAEESVYTDADFVSRSAYKVSVSDTYNVPSGKEVILYTRIWNASKTKYEFYAVDHNGDLVTCYESGDTIAWIGTQNNTLLWKVTDLPNQYYQLQNTYSEKYISPEISGTVFTTDENALNNRVNLGGRQHGDYYTTILRWDDPHYDYACIRTETGSIASGRMAQAEQFYFAIMDPPSSGGPKTEVETVNHENLGMTMKMVNYGGTIKNAPSNAGSPTTQVQYNVIGTQDYTTTNAQPGLLSTDIKSNGYPESNITGESLKDLFSNNGDIVKVYDANKLFIQSIYDSSGYFQFDSTENFAEFNENSGEFTVYQELGTVAAGSNTHKHGQFMPFNTISDTPRVNNTQNLTNILANPLEENNPRKYEMLYGFNETKDDYYFGMEISGSFMQTPNGLDAWGHDLIFDFVGDDDFWMYVDDELVIDLGGIHSALEANVNYSTGEVVVNGTPTTLYDLFRNNYRKRLGLNDEDADTSAVIGYLNSIFQVKDYVNGNPRYVFKDYSTHTVRIFYMERGAGASNLRMRFNLATVNPGQVLLSKEVTSTNTEVKDEYVSKTYPFQIFYKNSGMSDYNTWGSIPEQRNNVTIKNTHDPISYQATYSEGGYDYKDVFLLRPGQIAAIQFPDDLEDYFIRECAIDSEVYDDVKVNGDSVASQNPADISGTPGSGITSNSGQTESKFKYYQISSTPVKDRAEVVFSNNVKAEQLHTLTITKKLFDEDGNELTRTDDSTGFLVRIYLGKDASGDYTYYDTGEYHVKDENGFYCKFVPGSGFTSLGKTDYNTLTDSEKIEATFRTSPSGAADKIPANYSIEIRNLLDDTYFKVVEEDYDIPVGYGKRSWTGTEIVGGYPSTKDYLCYCRVNGSYDYDGSEGENVGRIFGQDATMEVHNVRGYGIQVNKVWSDTDFISEHAYVYVAVYIGNSDTPIPYTIHKIDSYNSTRYFFLTLESGAAFDDYHVYEVDVVNPVTDSNGNITSYTSITKRAGGSSFELEGNKLKHVNGGIITRNYTVTYTQGTPTKSAGSTIANIRTDTVTNTADGGLKVLKKDINGNPLQGGQFELRGSTNNLIDTYTADSDGHITTLYLDNGTYTLTETKTPIGHHALTTAIYIEVDNGVYTVSGGNSAGYEVDAPNATTLTIKNRPYTLEAIKIKAGNSNDPLKDAHFALYKQIIVNGTARKDYYPMAGYEDLITGTNGVIPNIDQNLSPGSYYLVETETPPGYSTKAKDVIITINPIDPTNPVIAIDDLHNDLNWLTSEVDSNGTINYSLKIPNPPDDQDPVAPTNYVTNYNPFFMMFGFGAILIGLIVPTVVMIKRRKEEEE